MLAAHVCDRHMTAQAWTAMLQPCFQLLVQRASLDGVRNFRRLQSCYSLRGLAKLRVFARTMALPSVRRS